MRHRWRGSFLYLLGWATLAAAGTLLIVRFDIAQRRESFQAEARTAHRLLSQRAAQHEAILATLVLLNPVAAGHDRPEARLAAVYPRVLTVMRLDAGESWSDPLLNDALARSLEARHATTGGFDAAAGRYTVVLASAPTSFALQIDAQRMVPWDDWPVERSAPVRAELVHAGQTILLQPGLPLERQPVGLTSGFVFAKTLAAPSQPFELRMQSHTGPAQWPWLWLVGWLLSSGLAVTALFAWHGGRIARRRAEELLRVGQVGRLNALGELAGGIAHELNQPLTALLANTQAARRWLDDEPPELATAREAMGQAAGQARRAAEVVARLRRLVEAPDKPQPRQPVRLGAAVRTMLDLLQPELQRRRISASLQADEVVVMADPVALEQIVHNLIGNAMLALDEAAASTRRLELTVRAAPGHGVLIVRDSGPGIAAQALSRLFEPFYTTRRGGLGLGLSLSQTLAQTMDGSLSAGNADAGGAEFRLSLPLAHSTP
ncbi:MAG: ATP-binding protein [Burkholderiaceae bacterium]